jgi:hypothetical protein
MLPALSRVCCEEWVSFEALNSRTDVNQHHLVYVSEIAETHIDL